MTGFHFGSSIDLISETVDHFTYLHFYKQGQLEGTVVARGGDPHGVQYSPTRKKYQGKEEPIG